MRVGVRANESNLVNGYGFICSCIEICKLALNRFRNARCARYDDDDLFPFHVLLDKEHNYRECLEASRYASHRVWIIFCLRREGGEVKRYGALHFPSHL